MRKLLKERAGNTKCDILLDIPEASGIEVFETMKHAGVIIERIPNIVTKVMIVGFKR